MLIALFVLIMVIVVFKMYIDWFNDKLFYKKILKFSIYKNKNDKYVVYGKYQYYILFVYKYIPIIFKNELITKWEANVPDLGYKTEFNTIESAEKRIAEEIKYLNRINNMILQENNSKKLVKKEKEISLQKGI